MHIIIIFIIIFIRKPELPFYTKCSSSSCLTKQIKEEIHTPSFSNELMLTF